MSIRFLSLVAALVAGVAVGVAGQSGSAQSALEAARKIEVVDGDFALAIARYQAVVDTYKTTDPTVAAQALLRMAEVHQRLEDAQAQKVYEKILKEFPGQIAAATEARAKLAAMGGASAGGNAAGDRVVWTDRAVFGAGDVSPDGHWISETDYFALKFILRDLRTNATRILAEWKGGASYTSTFSRDGKQLAYGWRTYGDDARPHINEIRVIEVDRAGDIRPQRIYGNDDVSIFNPLDWSPDGRSLAVFAQRKDNTGEIAIVGVIDGSYRRLKTVGWRGPRKMFFSPDGKYLAYDLPSSETAMERDVFVQAVDATTETHIKHPDNDVVMGWAPGGRLLFASDRSGSVGLWSLPANNLRSSTAASLVKPDIGTVDSLGTTNTGKLYVVKDASTEALNVAPIDLAAGRLSGPPVLQSFRSEYPGWSRDGRYLSYVFTNPSGIRILAVRSTESGQIRELRPALEYFRADAWLPDGKALVTWGRDLKGRGGIYRIDAETGAATLIVESAGITGVQPSPDGRQIYYNENFFTAASGAARFVERDMVTGEVREVFRPAPGVVPTGGRLSPDGRWLASVVINRSAKISSVVVRPVSGGEARTVASASHPEEFEGFISLGWTPDGEALLVAKMTAGRPGLWLLPVNGGDPRALDIDVSTWGGSAVRLHPNGRQILFFSGDSKREVYEVGIEAPRPTSVR